MASYSERHQVPTVQEYREIERAREEASRENDSNLPQTAAEEEAEKSTHRSLFHSSSSKKSKDADNEADADDNATDVDPDDIPRDDIEPEGGQAEKERLKNAAAPKDKPTHFKAKGTRKVQDPTTGGEVIIRDGDKTAKIDSKKLDSRYPGGFSTNVLPDVSHEKDGEKLKSSRQGEVHTSPHPAEPSNILLYPFPPPVEAKGLERLSGTFKQLAIALAGALGLIWFFTAFGAGWSRFFLRSTVIAGTGIAGWSALNIALRKLEKDLEDVRMHMHRARGATFSPPMPESVEWLNAAIGTIWKQIDPAMFIPIADQVEDVMQQSLPGFVDAVKVDDLGIGTNPFRFIAFRGLSDLMTDKEYPREEWITQGKKIEEKDQKKTDSAKKVASKDEEVKDSDGDGIADEDESGDFLNYEISFSYSALPGSARSDNIHL